MSVRLLSDRLERSKRILAFTGAGISTGSGIPDFRGPQGLWTKIKPVYFDDFIRSQEARVKHWQYKTQGWNEFRDARPNDGHRALVELEEIGKLGWVVTQNIDGLHQMAGHSPEKVIELHGTNRLVECCSCGDLTDPEAHFRAFERTGEAPICSCGGFLKPATVSFGQSMPVDKMKAALEAARQCDMVLAIGSTLEVEPAASVPRSAKTQGAFYAIVNLGPTAQDHLADLRLSGEASETLCQALRILTD